MMKKILFVTSKINGGGSENVLKIISEKFAKLNHKIFILVLDDLQKYKSNKKDYQSPFNFSRLFLSRLLDFLALMAKVFR